MYGESRPLTLPFFISPPFLELRFTLSVSVLTECIAYAEIQIAKDSRCLTWVAAKLVRPHADANCLMGFLSDIYLDFFHIIHGLNPVDSPHIHHIPEIFYLMGDDVILHLFRVISNVP